MSTQLPDIPARFSGNESIIVAELDGSPLVVDARFNAIVETSEGTKHSSELPVLASIKGLSAEAVESIADIVCNWHKRTGVPVMAITRSTLLQALVTADN